ncbi:hypothetical protein [Microcoleus sp. F4-D5]
MTALLIEVQFAVGQHDDKKLPENEELVIHELHVADFWGAEGSDSRSKF